MAVAALGPSALVSSDSTRAVQTAAEVADTTGLDAPADPRLREIALGAWQGLDGAAAERQFPAEWAAWQRGEDVRRGGGEIYAEVAVRALAALAAPLAALPPDGLLLTVTHGGTARALIGSLIGLPAGDWWRLGPLGNCRWSVLAEAPSGRGWRLAAHAVQICPAESG